MIRIALLAFWAVLAAVAARAETVTVRSGDHAGFARIVLQHGTAVDWTVARTDTGYVFRPGRDGIDYDLSQVWRLIGRDRLADIRPAAQGEGLDLSVGCDCHAFPFEIRPGVVVVDIRDGPPPPGSSFEKTEPSRAADDAARPGAAARASAGYDWLDLPPAPPRAAIPGLLTARAAEEPEAADLLPEMPVPVPAAADSAQRDPDLSSMRDALLRQVGRGMTQGILDPAPPAAGRLGGDAPTPSPAPQDSAVEAAVEPSMAGSALQDQIRILDPDGDALVQDGTPAPPDDPGSMTAVGAVCLSDQDLALQEWGDATPPAQALGTMSTGLIGEFDTPDPDAVRRAVRYLLHLGFGAEARQLTTALAPADPDRPVWASLARILDGGTDPAGAFTGMEVCDTAASLWALLAAERAPAGPTVATNAALRAFSALPTHLRRHLGPALAERFTARGDETAVQIIRDAILRAPGDPGDPVRLMEAERALSRGDPGSTEALADLTAATSTTAVEATVALLRDSATKGAAAPDSLVDAAEGLRRTYRGAPQEAELAAALALAQAAAGNFAAAFALAEGARPGTDAEVWALLGGASDAALLNHGVLAPGASPPPLPAETDRAIARRLIALGFPGPALAWLGPARRPAGLQVEDRLLIAEAALMRRDGGAALRALEGLEGPAADDLRQQAGLLQGDPPSEGAVADMLFRQALRGQDWSRLATAGPEPWRAAAARVTEPAAPPASEVATLAEGRGLLSESAETRAAIQMLLDASRP